MLLLITTEHHCARRQRCGLAGRAAWSLFSKRIFDFCSEKSAAAAAPRCDDTGRRFRASERASALSLFALKLCLIWKSESRVSHTSCLTPPAAIHIIPRHCNRVTLISFTWQHCFSLHKCTLFQLQRALSLSRIKQKCNAPTWTTVTKFREMQLLIWSNLKPYIELWQKLTFPRREESCVISPVASLVVTATRKTSFSRPPSL